MSDLAAGDRVRLVKSRQAAAIPGTEGTVAHVSEVFYDTTVYVLWDNLQIQALSPGPDDVIEKIG